MSISVTFVCTTETAFTAKLLPAAARYLAQRFAIGVTGEIDAAAAVVRLHDALPAGHPLAGEGYTISTRVEDGVLHYAITGETLGLAYGVGRLLREIMREGSEIRWPDLSLDEQPAVPFRGIYYPLQRTLDEAPIAFNAYNALLYDEGNYEKFEEILVEQIFWGLNAIGIWYGEHQPLPDDGAEGKRLARMYDRVVEIARSWRLRLCLLMTTNLLPYFAADDPLNAHRTPAIPDGLWGKFDYPHGYCPQSPEIRRQIRAYRDVLIQRFRPEWIEIFPTDPGGCACAQCAPWWETYLTLAKELLAPWVDRIPLRGINFWYFWNRDIATLAEHLGTDGIINTISTQHAWQESTRARLRVSDRLARRGYRIVYWPDITMKGGWGTFGTYPFPEELSACFRQARERPYGILPYTEGRYDDFNKFALLTLAWSPALSTATVTRQVLTGIFGQAMPEEAVLAIAALEERRYAQAEAYFCAAEAALDDATRQDWRWYALRFHARHALLGEACLALTGKLDAARARGETAPLSPRELQHFQRALARLEVRFTAYAAELPELYRQVNALQRRHRIGCGTTLPARHELRRRIGLDQLHASLRALHGERAAQAADTTTTMVDFRDV